jgi:hypothetical protein
MAPGCDSLAGPCIKNAMIRDAGHIDGSGTSLRHLRVKGDGLDVRTVGVSFDQR